MEEEYSFRAEKKLSLKILLKSRKKNEHMRKKNGKKKTTREKYMCWRCITASKQACAYKQKQHIACTHIDKKNKLQTCVHACINKGKKKERTCTCLVDKVHNFGGISAKFR